jgi:tRNA threonylcarbamoyladenosine biosynthesis protein TsaE
MAGKRDLKPGATNTLRLNSNSPAVTRRLGYILGKRLWPGAIIALIGKLGSGKTVLSQGILKGLGVRDKYMISPSFVLIKEYKGRLPAYHLDLFRLKNVKELNNLGLEEYLFGRGVAIIEWAEKIKSILPEEYLEIILNSTGKKEGREMLFSPHGIKYEKLIMSLKKLYLTQNSV